MSGSKFVSKGFMSYHHCTFGLNKTGLVQKGCRNWDQRMSLLDIFSRGEHPYLWMDSVLPKTSSKSRSSWLHCFLPHNVVQKFLPPQELSEILLIFVKCMILKVPKNRSFAPIWHFHHHLMNRLPWGHVIHQVLRLLKKGRAVRSPLRSLQIHIGRLMS